MAKKTLTIISVLAIMSLVIGITSMAKVGSNFESAKTCSSGINTAQIPEKKAFNISPNEKDMNASTENIKPGSSKNSEMNSDEQNSVTHNKNNEETTPAAIKAYREILAIGDSIILDTAPVLNKKYDNIIIDGKVGRQMSEAITLASKYAAFNAFDKAVIIELGTNGYFTGKQIDELLESFSKSHIFLINTHVPRPWETKVNETLKEKAKERENVTLIDWYSAASKHPEYFGQDGVHLTSRGVEALVSLIDEGLNSDSASK